MVYIYIWLHWVCVCGRELETSPNPLTLFVEAGWWLGLASIFIPTLRCQPGNWKIPKRWKVFVGKSSKYIVDWCRLSIATLNCGIWKWWSPALQLILWVFPASFWVQPSGGTALFQDGARCQHQRKWHQGSTFILPNLHPTPQPSVT